MRLKTLRVLNCFGFRDSGEVNFDSPGGFIYVLGRNSSGKTALLTALSRLTSTDAPSTHGKFANFTPTATAPTIAATFAGSLSRPQFISELRNSLVMHGLPREVVADDARIEKLLPDIADIYAPMYDAPVIEVHRDGSGLYQFHLPAEDPTQASGRASQVSAFLGVFFPNNTFAASNTNYGVSFVAASALSALALQLPRVILFNSAFRLLDDLPDRIDIATIDNPPSELTRALIAHLGESELREFLAANDPDRKRTLEREFSGRLTAIARAVAARGPDGQAMLINFDLYDLQLTVRTGTKKSFYRHLSEATKILVAYQIYTRADVIRDAILLFDEPNTGLHASVQRDLLQFLRTFASDNNLVIISTHSEHMIDLTLLPGVRLMNADADGHLLVDNHPYKHPLGQPDQLALQPVLDAIGLRLGDRIDITDQLLVVEGITELLFLRAFVAMLAYVPAVHLCPARGESTIPTIASVLISQGIGFKVLVDAGGDTVRIMKDMFGLSELHLREIEVPAEFVGRMRTAGIEDLFSRSDYRKILAACEIVIDEDRFRHVSNSEYAKHTPKRVVAERVLEGVREQWDFDAVTLAEFKSVLEFASNGPWYRV